MGISSRLQKGRKFRRFRQAGTYCLKLNSLIFSSVLHHSSNCRQEGLHLVLTGLQKFKAAISCACNVEADDQTLLM